MYRIVIDPDTASWIIQVQRFFLFWRQIGAETYPTYAAAKRQVETLGLDRVYRDYHQSFLHNVASGKAS